MGTISVTLPSDGSTADVSDYNTPINTIVTSINGNLDNDNIKAGAGIDGSKLADSTVTGAKSSGTYKVVRQDNTASSTETAARILTGWGVVQGNGTAVVSETVTFGSAFLSPPIVTITFGGDSLATTSTYGSGSLSVRSGVISIATNVTMTSFLARLQTTDAGTWSATNSIYYQWIAIGT